MQLVKIKVEIHLTKITPELLNQLPKLNLDNISILPKSENTISLIGETDSPDGIQYYFDKNGYTSEEFM